VVFQDRRGDNDVIFVVLIIDMSSHNFKNIFQCVRYLWRTEGPRGYVAGKLTPEFATIHLH
jgi:hypothetical protein